MEKRGPLGHVSYADNGVVAVDIHDAAAAVGFILILSTKVQVRGMGKNAIGPPTMTAIWAAGTIYRTGVGTKDVILMTVHTLLTILPKETAK